MLRVDHRTSLGKPTDVLALPYDDRKKSRLRVRSERGVEVAIVLERGSVLRDGDLLAADSGEILLVRAAAESVSEVASADARLLARAAYHLGNRHVPLQIELGSLRYQHDHVLDAMLIELGLQVAVSMAAFEPEGGAYAGVPAEGGHGHGHGHEHEHEHEHEHAHAHAHVHEKAAAAGRQGVMRSESHSDRGRASQSTVGDSQRPKVYRRREY
jgi:urease accessory protein